MGGEGAGFLSFRLGRLVEAAVPCWCWSSLATRGALIERALPRRLKLLGLAEIVLLLGDAAALEADVAWLGHHLFQFVDLDFNVLLVPAAKWLSSHTPAPFWHAAP